MGATTRAVAAAMLLVACGLMGYGSAAHADDVRDAQWHLEVLRVAEAHRHSLGEGVTVAVLDSGVDASHTDLRGNVLPGVDLTDRGTDGRDDPGGSGTALAGLIAGHGHGVAAAPDDADADDADADDADADDAGSGSSDEAVAPDGVLGVAPRAAILPVVVAPPNTSPAAAALAAGIDEAVRHGADVICIGRPVPDDPAVTRALGAAVAAGAVVVVPGTLYGDALARYGEAGLLGALPVARGDDPPPAGPTAVVAVPAVGLTSTGGQGGYYRFARTSDPAAAAVLAGAAALVRAAHPELSGYEAAHRIGQTAQGGRLDLVAALTAPVPAPPDPPAGPPPAPPPGTPGTPEPTEPSSPGAEPEGYVAAFDSDDWRRWLVAAPLVAFLAGLVALSVAAARRARRVRR